MYMNNQSKKQDDNIFKLSKLEINNYSSVSANMPVTTNIFSNNKSNGIENVLGCFICKQKILPIPLTVPKIINVGFISFDNNNFHLLNSRRSSNLFAPNNNLTVGFQVICSECFSSGKFYSEFERHYPKYTMIIQDDKNKLRKQISQLQLQIQEKDKRIKKLEQHQEIMEINIKDMSKLQNIPFLKTYRKLMNEQVSQSYIRLQSIIESMNGINESVGHKFSLMKLKFQQDVNKVRNTSITNFISQLMQEIKAILLEKQVKLTGREKIKEENIKTAKESHQNISVFNPKELNQYELFLNQYIASTQKEIKELKLLSHEADLLQEIFQSNYQKEYNSKEKISNKPQKESSAEQESEGSSKPNQQ